MNLAAFTLTMLCLLRHFTLADMVHKRSNATSTPSDSSPSSSINPATIPTPITTALPSDHPVALYIPQVDPSQPAEPVNVEYYGPGNGGSTVYQVVFPDQATPSAGKSDPPVSSTLCPTQGLSLLVSCHCNTHRRRYQCRIHRRSKNHDY